MKQSPDKKAALTPLNLKISARNPHSLHNALNLRERRPTGVHESYNTDRDRLTQKLKNYEMKSSYEGHEPVKKVSEEAPDKENPMNIVEMQSENP